MHWPQSTLSKPSLTLSSEQSTRNSCFILGPLRSFCISIPILKKKCFRRSPWSLFATATWIWREPCTKQGRPVLPARGLNPQCFDSEETLRSQSNGFFKAGIWRELPSQAIFLSLEVKKEDFTKRGNEQINLGQNKETLTLKKEERSRNSLKNYREAQGNPVRGRKGSHWLQHTRPRNEVRLRDYGRDTF